MGSSQHTLAVRATRIAMSPTMKVAAEAMALKAKGIDVIDLGAGEPDFPTPKHIGAAAHAAIDANFTKYTTNSGTDELKKAIVARYKTDYGVEYATNEVIVTAGGKQALFNAVMVLFGAGDEVITHMPGWPTLVEQIKLADATPVIVHTHAEDGFRLRADTFLEGAHAEDARHHHQLARQSDRRADVRGRARRRSPTEAAKRGIWILLDLCYEKLIYDPTPHNLPGVLVRTMRDRADALRVGVQGVRDDRLALRLDARAGGRRGRVQRAAEPLDVERLLDYAKGRSGRPDRAADVRHGHARRVPPPPRPALRSGSARSRGCACVKPAGAFYLFPDVSDFLSPDGVRTSAELAQSLLDGPRVALTPGEAFDAPGFVRISYAASMEDLERGAKKIIDHLRSVERPRTATTA